MSRVRGPHARFCERAGAGPDQPGATLLDSTRISQGSGRTTNLIERSFEEERRRTKVLPWFWTEHSALKLVFATLQRVTRRWQRVWITEVERKQIAALRRVQMTTRKCTTVMA